MSTDQFAAMDEWRRVMVLAGAIFPSSIAGVPTAPFQGRLILLVLQFLL